MKLSWFALLEDLEVFSSFQGQQVEPDPKCLANFYCFLSHISGIRRKTWEVGQNDV